MKKFEYLHYNKDSNITSIIENDKDMLVVINIFLLLQIFYHLFLWKNVFIDTVQEFEDTVSKSHPVYITKPSIW